MSICNVIMAGCVEFLRNQMRNFIIGLLRQVSILYGFAKLSKALFMLKIVHAFEIKNFSNVFIIIHKFIIRIENIYFL